MDFSSEMIYPLIPLFLSSVLGVNKSVIGLIEGIAESTASIVKVFSGWVSDRIGNRKWLMAAGYGIATLSRPIMATAGGWPQVMTARFVDRTGKGLRGAPRDALIADSTEPRYLGRAFGLQKAMDTFGAVVGPLTAYLLLKVLPNDYRLIFWLSIIPGTIAVLLIVLFIRDRKTSPPEGAKRPVFTLSAFDWRYKTFMLIMTIFAIGNSSDVFLILRAGQTGVPAGMIPLIYLCFNLVYSLSALPAGLIADRVGKKKVLLTGLVLFAVVYFGFARATSPGAVWTLFGIYGLFMGLSEGIQKAFLTTILPPDFKATGYGLYHTLSGLTMFPASLIGGLLWDRISPSATFYFGSVMAAISALLFVIYSAVLQGRR